MSICFNCDFQPASYRCVSCPSTHLHTIFCADCRDLHLKLKASKNHEMEPYKCKLNARKCNNCDIELAKFKCMNCDMNNCDLCNGCSILHGRIKQYRSHIILPIENNNSYSSIPQSSMHNKTRDSINDSHSDRHEGLKVDQVSYYNELLVYYLTIIFGQTIIERYRHQDWFLALLGIGIALIMYITCRWFLGRYSIIFSVLGTIFVYKLWEKTDRSKTIKVTPELMQRELCQQTKQESDNDDGSFKEEFWHNKPGRQATLRPRTRPFKKITRVKP